MADDPTPLASLSLTHVHYVSLTFDLLEEATTQFKYHLPRRGRLTLRPCPLSHSIGPNGPHILPVRLAGPGAARALCSIRDAGVVDAGGRGRAAVRGAAGMRGAQLRP